MTYNTNTDPLGQFIVRDDGNYDNEYNDALEASRMRQVRQMAGREVLTIMGHATLASIKMLGSVIDELVESAN